MGHWLWWGTGSGDACRVARGGKQWGRRATERNVAFTTRDSCVWRPGAGCTGEDGNERVNATSKRARDVNAHTKRRGEELVAAMIGRAERVRRWHTPLVWAAVARVKGRAMMEATSAVTWEM